MKRLVCVMLAGCGTAVIAGQVSDDFVTAARVAYAQDDGCHESIVFACTHRTTKDDSRPRDGIADDKNPGKIVKWIDVDGARNVRDIGGWTGLKAGRVFRGTELGTVRTKDGNSHGYDLTPAGLKTMREQMGIVTDFDLRGVSAAARGKWVTESAIGRDIRLLNHPIGSYMDAFTYKGEKDYGAALKEFARPEIYPVYIHCAGGADRTGTLCFLLETLCGVPVADARIEYELTSFSPVGLRTSNRESVQPFATMVRTLLTYPGKTFQEKVAYYAETVLRLTPAEIAAIRENLRGMGGVRAGTSYDVVVYGATPGGIAAAVQATRMGRSVVLLEPSDRIGGLTTGGLGQTDIGNKQAFGGLARDFYHDIAAHYRKPGSWRWEKRSDYVPDGQCAGTSGSETMWTFEPSAAQAVLAEWEAREKLCIVRNAKLDRSKAGVTRKDGRLISLRTLDGAEYRGKMFVDATYEGDLMAAAGVSYTVGREANATYGETLNGMQPIGHPHHNFDVPVDPYVVKGDPSSGLLPGIESEPMGKPGEGDRRVQAYCFRMTLTDCPENRIPFAKPAGYDERDYELLFRYYEGGAERFGLPWINSRMPNRKTDTNNRCGFSSDFIGQNHRWPEASYDEREKILAAHLKYQQGLMWTLANHPRIPEKVRAVYSKWGLCRDEFTATGGWTPQLYVREARRLVGDYVMTESNCLKARVAPCPVALAAYQMDSHHVRRYVTSDGRVRNEGDVEVGCSKGPFGIDYGAIVPKRGECANLLVPVCLSASHIAFGSIRMEPVFFALGQAAGTAAALSVDEGCAVQDLDYGKLRARLLADGQRLPPESPQSKCGLMRLFDSLAIRISCGKEVAR